MNPLPADIENAIEAFFTPQNMISRAIQQHEWELRTFLECLLTDLKPHRTVELGSYRGFTAALLSMATTGQTVSVDVVDYGTDLAKPYGRNLQFVHGDAAVPECVERVAGMLDGPIDLLFVDDGHYYEQTRWEFTFWKPKVRPGGWMVFHDINPLANRCPNGEQPPECQTTRFWQELEGNKREIIATEEHKNWRGPIPHGGLGIYIV